MTCSYETERIAEDRDRLVITQRSQVRILSPLPAEMAPGDGSGGPFSCPLDTYVDTLDRFPSNRCLPSLLDSGLLPGVMAFPFFGGASVIVCQGADLIAIRSRRPPQGDTAAVTAKCRVFGRGLPGPTKCSLG